MNFIIMLNKMLISTFIAIAVSGVLLVPIPFEVNSSPLETIEKDRNLYPETEVRTTGQFFIENIGQWDDNILFKTRSSLGSSLICKDGLYIDVLNEDTSGGCVLKYGFPETHPGRVRGLGKLDTSYNYLIGDRSEWAVNVPVYSEVLIEDIWKDIDARFYLNDKDLKYDLICAQGSDPGAIRFDLDGIRSIGNNEDELIITLENGMRITDGGLLAYRNRDLQEVDIRYEVINEKSFSFNMEEIVQDTIIIDPVIFGSFIPDCCSEAIDIFMDDSGTRYILGESKFGLRTTPGAYQEEVAGSFDAYVMKINGSDNGIVFCTYVGGSGIDHPYSMDVDDKGRVWFTGETYSENFPVSQGCYNGTMNGYLDAFAARLSANGSDIERSTFFGGSSHDHGKVIALDGKENVVVYGETVSPDLPMSGNSQCREYQRFADLFVAVFDQDLSRLSYSTYLGYRDTDSATSMAIGNSGILYLGGYTRSIGFPVSGGTYDQTFGGTIEGFIIRLDPDGRVPFKSTLIGGGLDDRLNCLSIAPDGDLIVGGDTSSNDPWATEGAYQRFNGGGEDIFLIKIDRDLKDVSYVTYLGSTGNQSLNDIFIDKMGRVHGVGYTDTIDMQTTWGAWKTEAQKSEAVEGLYFIMNETGTGITYLTYLGGAKDDYPTGLALGDGGKVHICGKTKSSNFPPFRSPGWDKISHGADGFFIVLDTSLPPSQPRDLDARWSVGWVNLSWKEPLIDNGYPVEEYLIEKNTGAGFFLIEKTQNPYINLTMIYEEILGIKYRVCARSAAGNSNHTSLMLIPPVRNLGSSIHFDRIELNWLPPGDIPFEIDGYILEKTSPAVNSTTVFETNKTSFADENVTKGYIYNYSIRVVVDGFRSVKEHISVDYVTLPEPPKNLEILPANHSVLLKWESPQNIGGSEIIGYHIYRGAGGFNETHIATVKGDIFSYQDNSTTYGVNYSYRISSINRAGQSNRTEPVSIKLLTDPKPPWNVTLTVGKDRMVIMWEPPFSDGGSPIENYHLFRSVNGGDWYHYMTFGNDSFHYNDTSVGVRIFYSYYLTSKTEVGESLRSDIATGILEEKPSSPGSLTGNVSSDTVTLRWDPPGYQGHSTLKGYKLYKRINNGSFMILDRLSVDRDFYIDDDISLGFHYAYRVTAFNSIGESSASEEFSFHHIKPPTPPKNLVARVKENGIELDWFPSEEGGGSILRYEIYRGTDPEKMELYADVSGLFTYYTDKEAEVGVSYYYGVSSFNSYYNSTMSQVARCIIKTMPGPVRDCSGILTNDSIRLTWSPPDFNGGAEIIQYYIYRLNENRSFDLIGRVPGNRTEFEDLDLDRTGLYVYYVVAENEMGIGPESIKFDVEVSEEVIDNTDQGLETPIVVALSILGTCTIFLAISVFITIFRRSKRRNMQNKTYPRAEFMGFVTEPPEETDPDYSIKEDEDLDRIFYK